MISKDQQVDGAYISLLFPGKGHCSEESSRFTLQQGNCKSNVTKKLFFSVPHKSDRYGDPLCVTMNLYSKLQAFKYQEQYNEALAGFSQGAALDPTWSEPQEKEKELCNYLAKVHELVKAKVSNQKHQRQQTLLDYI